VKKWQTAHIQDINIDKSKHVHVNVGGSTPISLHFNAGSKDNADAIVTKLESSKELSGSSLSSPLQNGRESGRRMVPPLRTDIKTSKKASVHFSAASPVVIPPRESSDDEDDDEADQEPDVAEQSESLGDADPVEGDVATALYDFDADGEDELSVKEGDRLLVLEGEGDEWWKVRNERGAEGVVPASYVEV
jgi:actin cytoskeleton-regulatory complex protein SLA1